VVRVALICDFPEEQWISMDLVADMLLERLRAEHHGVVEAVAIRPAMRPRITSIPITRDSRVAFNTDRFVSRFRDYPKVMRQIRGSFEIFHIIDHSYAHLAHYLPAERTVVTCHDIDAFRCLVAGKTERRSFAFRAMTKRIASGMRRAARVNCDSAATRDAVVRHGLAEPERTTVIHNGVHPEFVPDPNPQARAQLAVKLCQPRSNIIELVHAGSAAPRKRIDVLIRILSTLRAQGLEVRLIKAGSALTQEQRDLAGALNCTEAIVELGTLPRATLAELYRRAALVIVPSDAEGFGLPAVEAMACGTPVVATDLPVFREIVGDQATLCRQGDISAWSTRIAALIEERSSVSESWRARQARCVAHASRFSWSANAAAIVRVYRGMLRDIERQSEPSEAYISNPAMRDT